jgi:hypothetical protein
MKRLASFVVSLSGFLFGLNAFGQGLHHPYKYNKVITIDYQKVNNSTTNIYQNDGDRLNLACSVKWTNNETNGLFHQVSVRPVIFDPAGGTPFHLYHLTTVKPGETVDIRVNAFAWVAPGVDVYATMCIVTLSSTPFQNMERFAGGGKDFEREIMAYSPVMDTEKLNDSYSDSSSNTETATNSDCCGVGADSSGYYESGTDSSGYYESGGRLH